MKNGDYILIKAPSDWEGNLYRERYIYEHHYNYWKGSGHHLKDDEIIHHINGDKHDNRYINLEKISRVEHSRQHSSIGKTMVRLKCPVCGKIFEREKRNTHLIKSTTVTCCSRSCSGSITGFVKSGGDINSLVEGNVIEIFKD